MKLTDEKVAEALGYFLTTKGGVPSIRKRTADNKWDRGSSLRLPAFTTSLDAIVAEIEARGLAWFVQNNASEEGVNEEYFAEVDNQRFSAHASSAPLALCAALLQFLKESNRG